MSPDFTTAIGMFLCKLCSVAKCSYANLICVYFLHADWVASWIAEKQRWPSLILWALPSFPYLLSYWQQQHLWCLLVSVLVVALTSSNTLEDCSHHLHRNIKTRWSFIHHTNLKAPFQLMQGRCRPTLLPHLYFSLPLLPLMVMWYNMRPIRPV